MTHKEALISILVCNYNYSQYIEEALESILKQDYKNIEIIIVDDGSQDDSVDLIKTYIDKHPEATFLLKAKNKNMGLCYARNDAIEMARGDYLLFLDSDDTLPSNYVTSLYETAVINNADVVYGDVKHFGDDTGVTDFPEYNQEKLLLYNYINISSLIKKSKIGKQRFDIALNRRTLEDYDFWMGLSLIGLKFVKAKGVFLNYRIQNQSRNKNEATLETRVLKFIEIWRYSIDKYKRLYPKKIKDDIIIDELEYQIGQVGHELIRLNSSVHDELIPELKRREVHIEYLNAAIEILQQQNNRLESSIDRKLGSIILKPLRAIKRRLLRQ